MSSCLFRGCKIGGGRYRRWMVFRDAEITAAGNCNDAHRWEGLANRFDRFHTVDLRHDDIGDDEIRRVACEFGKRVHCALNGTDRISRAIQHVFDGIAHVGLIVDDHFGAGNSREKYSKRGPHGNLRLDGNASTETLYDAMNHGEPQTCALPNGPRGKERLEYALNGCRVHSPSRVANPEFDARPCYPRIVVTFLISQANRQHAFRTP